MKLDFFIWRLRVGNPRALWTFPGVDRLCKGVVGWSRAECGPEFWVGWQGTQGFRTHLRWDRGTRRSIPAALIEVVLRNWFGLGGIETGRLIEVVREGFKDGLFWFSTWEPHSELGLGWPPGGMDERGRGGFADMGEDSGNGLGMGEEGDKREGCLAGRTDQGENFIDPGEEGRPLGRAGGGGVWILIR